MDVSFLALVQRRLGFASPLGEAENALPFRFPILDGGKRIFG